MKKKSFRFAPSVSQPTFVRRRKREIAFWFAEILKRTIDHETGCGWWTATSCDEHRMRQGMAPLPDTR